MTNALKAKFFRGLADPSRLTVLEMLRQGPRCVSELVKATRLSQPNLSMHLACLRECGLVRARRNGRFIYYELADPGVVRLLQNADHALRRVARQIQACQRYEETRRTHGTPKRAKSEL